MKRFIIFLIIVITLAVGIVGFWYWKRNTYSKDILKLEILGPAEVAIAQEVEYTVKYKNNGNVRLEDPRLIFEFPENTLLPEGMTRRQEISAEELGGDIYPGAENTFAFKGRLFGKEDDIKTAKVWLSFKPKNIKARYESANTLNTKIKSVPLTFDFDLPSKAEAGRDFKFSLNYFSALNYPLTNLGIKIDYPQNFEFIESTPKSLAKNEWEIPLLNRAEGGRIEIKGKLLGEAKEQKIFMATLGIWQEDDFILLKEATQGVEITKPGLNVFQMINGDDNYTANAGDLLHYEIFFRNTGEEPFTDLFLVARLEGNAFDLGTIKSDVGQFNSGDNSIIWDWRKVGKLRFLNQGEEGKVEFWVNLKEDLQVDNPQGRNFSVKDTVLVSQTKEEFITKINSKVAVLQKVYFQDEIFGNSGPIPPRSGETTTFTIIWQAQNYYNDLKNVKIKAILPANVYLTGKIYPEESVSKFALDSKSREIVWTVKDSEIMEAGTGVVNNPPMIAFQVALTPAFEQKGRTAQIIGEARLTGEDQWTEIIIEKRASAVDTTLPDDSSVDHQGIVE